jgi:hypothetical protein
MDIGGIVLELILAVGLGVAFALSLWEQLRLQQLATSGAPGASLFKRVTMAGLSLSILLLAVLIGKWATISYETFVFIAAGGAIAALVIRKRSNRTMDADARGSGARGSS